MAKRSGSKTSRSERRAGRERADRAREHGLPARRDATPRARASTPEPRSHSESGGDRSSDAPRPAKPVGIPTLVKVVGGALALLVGVYLVTLLRDEAPTDTQPAPEVVATSAAPELEPGASALPGSPPVIAPEPLPVPPVSVAVPEKPVVAAPAVSAPRKPKVPQSPAPPQPAAPKPAAPPVDNPY
jgi:hypothetical protein